MAWWQWWVWVGVGMVCSLAAWLGWRVGCRYRQRRAGPTISHVGPGQEFPTLAQWEDWASKQDNPNQWAELSGNGGSSIQELTDGEIEEIEREEIESLADEVGVKVRRLGRASHD